MDRMKLVWGASFAYLAYAAVGDAPALSRDPAFSIVTSSSVFIVLYFVHSYLNLGGRTALKYFAAAALIGYGFEYLFITTGLVGHYVYTADLSPLLGPIPVFIPLLWASLGYFCLLAADNYVVSAFLMVFLDMAFDPRFSKTLWAWVPPGPYFGVPVANFVGWFVTSLAIYAAFYLATRRRAGSSVPAIVFYLVFGLANGSVPDFFSGLYGAGEISLVIFAAATSAIYLNLRRRRGVAPPVRGLGKPSGGGGLPYSKGESSAA
ncbi:MAG: carotenoid biosynthesis protein [Nitrososphaerota archaeon]|nr:carotenoid biosynthesis protein [Nitrososphaerota archaeon]